MNEGTRHWRTRRNPLSRLAMAMFLLVVAMAYAGVCVSAAYASDLGPIESLDTKAHLDVNGVLHVEETRVVTIDDDRGYFRWTFPDRCSLENGTMALDESRPITIADSSGTHDLERRSWTQQRVDDATSYSWWYERAPKTFDSIYIYGAAPGESARDGYDTDGITVTLRYRLDRQVYENTRASLLWEFIGPHWLRPTKHVHVELELPGEHGESDIENVVALSSGPSGYHPDVSLDGQTGKVRVTVDYDHAATGRVHHADVHFPLDWLDREAVNFAPQSQGTTGKQESQPQGGGIALPNDFTAAMTWWLVVSAVAIAIALSYRLSFIGKRFGKRGRSAVRPSHALPSDDNPAFVAYLHLATKGRKWFGQALTAGVIDLSRRGALKVSDDGKEFTFAEEPLDEGRAGDDIALYTYKFLKPFAKEGNSFTLTRVSTFAIERPNYHLTWCKSWMDGIRKSATATEHYGVVDRSDISKRLMIAAAVLFAVQLVVCLVLFNAHIVACVGTLVTDAAAMGAIYLLHKRSVKCNQAGCDLLDRCDAFALWLDEPSASSVIESLDDGSRAEYLAYAYALGSTSLGESREPGGSGSMAAGVSAFAGAGLMYAIGDDFAQRFGSTMSTAHETIRHDFFASTAGGSGGGGGGCGGGGGGGGGGGCGGCGG